MIYECQHYGRVVGSVRSHPSNPSIQSIGTKEKQEAIRVMEQSQFGMTGQNKVWLAGNVLIRGLLLNDAELIKEARENICSEIVLGQKEGIQPDWSFHQHGPLRP